MSASDVHLCTDELDLDLDEARAALARDARQPPKYRLAAEGELLWTAGDTLYVRFLEPDPELDKAVIEIARTWSRFANISFDVTHHKDAQIRVSYKGSQNKSKIGTKSKGETGPSLWIPSARHPDWRQRVVLHEFGHALGCIHEHSSPKATIGWKRDAVLEHYRAMGRDDRWTEINVFQRYDKPHIRASDFDPRSIMIYPIPGELLEDPEQAVPWNHSLSEADQRYIATLYPFPT